jgi:hypothetical protein
MADAALFPLAGREEDVLDFMGQGLAPTLPILQHVPVLDSQDLAGGIALVNLEKELLLQHVRKSQTATRSGDAKLT